MWKCICDDKEKVLSSRVILNVFSSLFTPINDNDMYRLTISISYSSPHIHVGRLGLRSRTIVRLRSAIISVDQQTKSSTNQRSLPMQYRGVSCFDRLSPLPVVPSVVALPPSSVRLANKIVALEAQKPCGVQGMAYRRYKKKKRKEKKIRLTVSSFSANIPSVLRRLFKNALAGHHSQKPKNPTI